jgi:hypothetical protein
LRFLQREKFRHRLGSELELNFALFECPFADGQPGQGDRLINGLNGVAKATPIKTERP